MNVCVFFVLVVVRLALVAVGAQDVAKGHLIVEDGLDLGEGGALGAVVHEAGDAASFAREGALALHLGGLVPMVELKGDDVGGRDLALAREADGRSERGLAPARAALRAPAQGRAVV